MALYFLHLVVGLTHLLLSKYFKTIGNYLCLYCSFIELLISFLFYKKKGKQFNFPGFFPTKTHP